MIRPGIWRRELAVPLQSLQNELNRLFEEYGRDIDYLTHKSTQARISCSTAPSPS